MMDMDNEVVSVGESKESVLGNKGICILVVNDDLICNNIVSEMLQHCNYQVLHVGSVLDVLNALWETKDNLDMVLTNAHKLESNGMVIVQHIQKKLNLPVIFMCADKKKISLNGQPFIFSAYVLKGLSRNDVNNLWQFALEKEKNKMTDDRQDENVQKASISNNTIETNKTYASTSEPALFNQKRKKKDESLKEKSEGGEEDPPIAKKPRVVWTIEMHQRFLEAIEIIGYEEAVPKKIVEVMGIAGLTRENVASHLQKFRGSTKRTQVTAKEGEIYKNIVGGLQLNDISGVNKLQNNYVSNLQLTPDFGIYGDRMRNNVLSIDKNSSSRDYNQSTSGKFVGYRLSDDGNTIEFGKTEESTNDDTISKHQDSTIQSAEKPGNEFPVHNSSFDDFIDDEMLKGTEDKCSQLDWEEFDDVFFEHDD